VDGHVAVAADALQVAAQLLLDDGALLQDVGVGLAGGAHLAGGVEDLAGGDDHGQQHHDRHQELDDGEGTAHGQSSLTVA
jgi:hypothetical protein